MFRSHGGALGTATGRDERRRASRPKSAVVASSEEDAVQRSQAEGRDEEASRGAACLDGHLERAGHVQVRRQQTADLGGGGWAGPVRAARRLVEVREPGGGVAEGRVAALPVVRPAA